MYLTTLIESSKTDEPTNQPR